MEAKYLSLAKGSLGPVSWNIAKCIYITGEIWSYQNINHPYIEIAPISESSVSTDPLRHIEFPVKYTNDQ